jgi:hypothetical protein
MSVAFFMRRTGIAVLGLLVATNSLPWMELVAGRSMTSEVVSARSEFGVAIGTCVLAALLVIGAWLSGRRLPVPAAPRLSRPRSVGLALAMLCAAINIALAGVIRLLAARGSLNLQAELWLFSVVWYLVVLPMQVIAAFCKGRASIPLPPSVGERT